MTTKTPDPRIERVSIASLVEDPANVRRHPERNLEAIKGSLARFGQQSPIVVDADNVVRAGNGRLRAARALGWSEIDVVRTELRGAEATAFAIADNRTAELAEWDEVALEAVLRAAQTDDPTLRDATGYTEQELWQLSRLVGTDFGEPDDPDAADGDAPDAPDGESTAEGGDDDSGLGGTKLKLVQIYVELDEYPDFCQLIRAGCEAYMVETPTEVILAVLRERFATDG